MNFKFDKDTAIIIAIGCLLMTAWFLYMPKYQAKKAEEYQRMLEATQQNAAPGTAENVQPASGTEPGPGSQISAASGETPAPAESVPALTETKTVVLSNDLAQVTVDGLTGALSSVKLTGDRYKLKDSGDAIELFRDGAYRTFELKADRALVPVSLDVTDGSDPRSAQVVRTFSGGLKLTQT